jgi:hypothetical protein
LFLLSHHPGAGLVQLGLAITGLVILYTGIIAGCYFSHGANIGGAL